MQSAGYLSQKKRSPTGFTLIVLAHVGLLGALAMAKGPQFIGPDYTRTEVNPIPIPVEPPPERPRETERTQAQPETPTTVETPIQPPIIDRLSYPPLPPLPPQPPRPPVETAIRTDPPIPRASLPQRARANLGSYFSTDDYPAAALRAEAEGRTSFTLGIGADGRVTSCTVTGSSGNSALDSATCRLLRTRARYTPARDQNRNPVSGQDRGSVTWRLPSE